ncbi:hypothetical protein SAMN05216420_101394 [Nitrosospira sp. Nl5]|nr:hypothetical protein SAMN05216420_101394 [Nitrosospira sp. Nl5]
MAPYTASSTNPKYFLSNGPIDSANAVNLFVASSTSSLGYSMNGPNVQTSVSMTTGQFALCYGRRISGSVRTGEISLSTFTHNQSVARSESGVCDGGNLYIGCRSDLSSTRMAQGHISWVALLSTGLSDADLVALANGTKVLVDDFSANIVELWDMAANAATITGSSGHVLTRVGTGFGTDGTDPLPYTTGSTTIAFSGTIATQNGNVDSVFSLDVSSYFSGSETPFSYSLQAGTLPAGLSLSGSVISGTPTGVETQAGIVIRGTDTATSTADSNTFSIDIAAAIVSTKGIQITLNSRASLEPVVSVTAITARFWDSATAAGAPLLKTDTASLDGSGVIELDIDSVTSLSVGDYGYLSLYKAGATPADDLHFAGRVPVVDIGA